MAEDPHKSRALAVLREVDADNAALTKLLAIPEWFREFVLGLRCAKDNHQLLMSDQTFQRRGDGMIAGVACQAVGETHHSIVVGFLQPSPHNNTDEAGQAVAVLRNCAPQFLKCPFCKFIVSELYVIRYHWGRCIVGGRCLNPLCQKYSGGWEISWVYQDPIRQGPAIEDEDLLRAHRYLLAIGPVNFSALFGPTLQFYQKK